MKAVKGNKVYLVDENNKKAYQDRGFDILDDGGEVIAYGRGKTVSYDDYAALKTENEALKKKNAALEAAVAGSEESEKKPGKK